MYIFIDESGSFAFPQHGKNSLACVGALTVAESCHAQVVDRFSELERSWGFAAGHIKGRDLCEAQIALVISFLLSAGTKFHVCITDMSVNNPPGVMKHRQEQARRLAKHLTAQHQPPLVAQFEEAATTLASLSPQLYVQFCMMTQLVVRQLRDTLLYYAFKGPPAELGSYHWVLHAKNEKPTAYEQLWKNLIGGFLQTESFKRHVLMTVEGGDYSHFERFCKTLEKWPDHLPARRFGKSRETPVEVIDISKIMNESFTVTKAETVPGLRLADICINAFRRALVGNLKCAGWSALGKLMLKFDKPPVIKVSIDLENGMPTSTVNASLATTIAQIESDAEVILPT